MKYQYTILILFLTVSILSTAQYNGKNTISLESLYSTGTDLPFWMSHNQWGKYDTPAKSNQLVSIQSDHRVDNLFKTPLDLNIGANFIGTYSNRFSFHFNELYSGASLWHFKLEAGWFRDGVNYSGLSSTNGFIDRSLNARPYPKIRFGTDQFIHFLFFKKWFSYKAEYDEGWLGNEQYVKETRMHHKVLYFKFKLKETIFLTGGLSHYVMWGGISPDPRYGKLPSDFHSYLLYITGGQGDASFPETDQYNVAGNQFGAYLMQLDIFKKNCNLTFYYSHPFEDRSGLGMDNWRDNLLGVFIDFKKRAIIENALYEFMYTIHQSGPIHQYRVMRGRDNYFNHGYYRSGYTYKGYTMASPLFSPLVFNDTISLGIENTRIAMHHIGLKGALSENIGWEGRFTYSHNLGTYDKPYVNPKDQFSSILSLDYSPPKFPVNISLSLAADVGELYENRFGVMIKLLKSW
jgi:hypothetical protein